jgi:NADPH-dependent 2,4-dienoyl-CoA reductase/sulfur reductase-like enzyme
MAELVIVGGGPAGLAAARTAARCGVQVMLVDENHRLGGQFYRDLPPQARAVIEEIHRLGVDVRLETTAWGIFDQRTLAIANGDRAEEVEAKILILAPGAFDRPVPFPGWTLPGVMTAGGAQNLMKAFGVVPGERVAIVGSGPLLLVVAHHLLAGGSQVVALCEAASMRGLWRYAPRMASHLNFVRQAYGYWREIRSARIPVHTGTVVRRAFGTSAVDGVQVSRCDARWRPIAGTEQRFEVDALIVGYGFVSSVELARLAGCKLRFREDLDGWVPVRSDELETSVPGLFIAGDGAGAGGSAVALAEGELTGLAAARRVGKLSERAYARRRKRVQRKLRHLAGFRGVMDEIYRVGPGLYELADADTIVCRCEEVRLGSLEATIDGGAALPGEVKALSRIGMGRCQGRMCGPALVHALARKTGRLPHECGALNPRPPVKPIRMGALVGN